MNIGEAPKASGLPRFPLKKAASSFRSTPTKRRASADVCRVASEHIGETDAKIAELKSMRKTLSTSSTPVTAISGRTAR